MNIANQFTSSLTEQLTLEEVVAKLQQQPEIDAILLAGTTGKATLKPYSDYDLLIILNEMAQPPTLLVTVIDDHLAELYFLTAKTADQLLQNPLTVEANTLHGAFVSMIVRGEIMYDASDRLAALRDMAPETHIDEIVNHQIYAVWYSVTYNHAQNVRYFQSNDPLYLTALQCRLLYCISNCLTAYFTLRGRPWRGEKEAIRYLETHDSAFLRQFQATITAGDIQQQFPQYEQLVHLTLPDGLALWPDSYTVVEARPNLTADQIHCHLRQWEQWLTPTNSA